LTGFYKLNQEAKRGQLAILAEWLHRELMRAKLEAECHCRRLKTGRVDWYPLLTQAIHEIQYWKGWAK